MKYLKLTIIIGLLAQSIAPLAASAADGNKLLSACIEFEKGMNGADEFDATKGAYCFGFAKGVFSAQKMLAEGKLKICPPNNVTASQSARILLKFLKDNPSYLHLEENTLAVSAFALSFGCKE